MIFQSIDKCCSCGSENIKKGSPYLDDLEAYERAEQGLELYPETWECDDCGAGGGGANYWQ